MNLAMTPTATIAGDGKLKPLLVLCAMLSFVKLTRLLSAGG